MIMDMSKFYTFNPAEHWPAFAFLPSDDWGKCVIAFCKNVHERSGSIHTLIRYEAELAAFFASDPPRLPTAYTQDDVLRYMHQGNKRQGQIGQPVKIGTQNGRLSTIRALYAYAATYGVLDAGGILRPLFDQLSPAAGLKMSQRERPGYRTLTESDLHKFFSVIPQDNPKGLRDRALCLTLFHTARRLNEVLNLKFGDLSQGIIRDPATGKQRIGYLYAFRGKGKSRTLDSAEMSPVVYTAIVRALEAEGRLATIQPGDYLFVPSQNSKYYRAEGADRISGQAAWRTVKFYARKSGLPESQVTPHAFRHSSALARFLAGQSIVDIKTALRHSSLDMTYNYVRELCNESDNAIDLLTAKYGSL
jgi:integrase